MKANQKSIAILFAIAFGIGVLALLWWVYLHGVNYSLEREALYQIQNSDTVKVNRNHSYTGYEGTFYDTYGREYTFKVTVYDAGVFTEIDSVFECSIKPVHLKDEITLKSDRYSREFYKYVEHVYKHYKRLNR